MSNVTPPRDPARGSTESDQHRRADPIVGTSFAIRRCLELAERAACSDAPVLLEGETGTGKELFARLVHARSGRAGGPLVALNCGAIAGTLLESELFGHVRGAFTGAEHDRCGLFEAAGGGALFLDEVGEMSLPAQASLLRVLEDGTVRPVGSTRSRSANVRVIAATNRDLASAVRDGHFRPDLYYRLRVFPIRLPPLRERPEDIHPLALHFLARYAGQEGKRIPGFAPESLQLLERHRWPGNVRQLEHEIRRLVLLAPEDTPIAPGLLDDAIVAPPPREGADQEQPLRDILREVELATLRERLERYGYHRTAAARSLGITRETLWAKLRQLGVVVPRRRMGGS